MATRLHSLFRCMAALGMAALLLVFGTGLQLRTHTCWASGRTGTSLFAQAHAGCETAPAAAKPSRFARAGASCCATRSARQLPPGQAVMTAQCCSTTASSFQLPTLHQPRAGVEVATPQALLPLVLVLLPQLAQPQATTPLLAAHPPAHPPAGRSLLCRLCTLLI